MLRRRFVALFSCWLLAGLTVSSCAGAPLVAAQDAPRLDLAALTLVPADLSGPGWVHDGAFMEDRAAEARTMASYRGGSVTAQQIATKMQGFGWQRKYVDVLTRPAGADPTNSITEARAYITEYATADGAAAGFSYLEDESMVATAADVAGTQTVGDQSEITKDAGVDSSGKSYHSLDLTFRTGNLVAGVTLISSPWHATFTTPDVATIEALGNVLLQRVAAPPAPGTTLGVQVQRLGGEQYRFTTYDDAYYRWNGGDIPIVDETAATAKARVASYKNATDVYQLWQGISGVGTGETLYGVTLLRFPSVDDAASWVDNLETILKANQFYGDIRTASIEGTLGDQAVALTYAPGGGGASAPHATLIAVRVGSDVARVHVVPAGSGGVPPVVVEELAAYQATCLRGGPCPNPTQITPGLAALIAGSLATPVPATPIPATPIASPVASPAALRESEARRD